MPAAPAPAPRSLADSRALLSDMWDRVHPPEPGTAPLIERLADAPCPPGFAVFRVGGPRGACTAMPALIDSAPIEVHERYRARIISNTTGTCPMCSAVATISADPQHRPAAWNALPVTVAVRHYPDCPTTFEQSDAHWFHPSAVPQTGGARARGSAWPPRLAPGAAAPQQQHEQDGGKR